MTSILHKYISLALVSYNPRVLWKDGVGFPSEVLVLIAMVGRFISINDEGVQILELTLAVDPFFEVKKLSFLDYLNYIY